MEQRNIMTNKENSAKTNFWKLFLWIVPTLFLILLAGITVIGIYLAPQDGSAGTSQLVGLSKQLMILAVIFAFIGILTIYISVRWIQIPAWRWIASGFKGEPCYPHLPWITKLAMTKAKSKMNRKQRACMWLGNVCMLVGIIPITIGVVWFIVLDITGEHTVGSTSLILFWIGIIMFFTGVCIVRISIPKCTQNMALPQNREEE